MHQNVQKLHYFVKLGQQKPHLSFKTRSEVSIVLTLGVLTYENIQISYQNWENFVLLWELLVLWCLLRPFL